MNPEFILVQLVLFLLLFCLYSTQRNPVVFLLQQYKHKMSLTSNHAIRMGVSSAKRFFQEEAVMGQFFSVFLWILHVCFFSHLAHCGLTQRRQDILWKEPRRDSCLCKEYCIPKLMLVRKNCKVLFFSNSVLPWIHVTKLSGQKNSSKCLNCPWVVRSWHFRALCRISAAQKHFQCQADGQC